MDGALPMLDEHQAPQALNTTNPAEYQATAEEKKAIKMVQGMFDRAKKHRQRYDEKWLDYYKMFRGKQWKERRPQYRHSEVINMVFQCIQSQVPIITDSRPKLEFIPTEPSDMELAEILNKVADHDWRAGNWLNTLTEVVYDSHFFGAGFSECGFDPDAEDGMGRVSYESEDPFYIYPDPSAKQINHKTSRYFIVAKPVPMAQLKREYPEKSHYIKADLLDISSGDRTELGNIRFKSPTDTRVLMEGEKGYDLGDSDKSLKITCYMIDDTVDETEEQYQEAEQQFDPVTQTMIQVMATKTRFVQKLRYPNGRKICMASGIILDDDSIEFDDGRFPFSKHLNYLLPREFWGISEVEQIESPQKIFNKLVSYALDVLTLMGNPIWVVDNNSGVDTDNLFNRPGLIVEKEPNSNVHREPGVELQPFVLQLIDRMRSWFDQINGANDVTRGVKPEGITAASAIAALQDSGQTRIRQKMRNLDAYLQDFGQQYISRVFQYYSAPRIVRLTNNDGAAHYFKFHVETRQGPDGNTTKVATVRNYNQNQETGEAGFDVNAKEFEIRGRFDVSVSTGSSLPFARQEKFSTAEKLFELGVIDDQELLKAADYPNWEAVLARVQKQKELAAQAQMQQQAQKGGPPA